MANMDYKQNSVDGGEFISEESSFYGDEEEKARLEALSAQSDVERWGAHLQYQVQTRAMAADAKAFDRSNSLAAAGVVLYNPYEGVKSGRQLSETVPEFLQRLPPSTTRDSEYGPWIFIANPYFNDQAVVGNWDLFTQRGREMLSNWLVKKDTIKATLEKRPSNVIQSAVTRERKIWEESVRNLASETGCMTGKWLLFRKGKEMDDAWSLIADATARNELGIGAKIATYDGHNGEYDRVICVYTANFNDLDDVTRVLKKLAEMSLVSKAKHIRYKTDAWTVLGIYSEQVSEFFNEYEFRTTLYSSQDLLESKESKKRKREEW